MIPAWVGIRGLAGGGTRACIRIGHRWPGTVTERHVLAYLVDSADTGTGMIWAWDVTAGDWLHVPMKTASKATGRWTTAPSNEQRQDAAEALALEIGGKVRIVKGLV